MKPFLVDVPVRLKIWCRPDCQKKQWDIIKKARPSILFIQSDGGRNEGEMELIYQNRKMIDESIDWDCKVYRFYEENNLGMYESSKKVAKFLWSKVDRCIFLEDDDVPSISFFKYCAELLKKYEDDQRVECICGHNYFGVWDKCNSDYFFSRQGSIHGFATWRRVVLDRNDYSYFSDKYIMSLLKNRTKHNRICWKRLNAYGENKYYENHLAGAEFWIEFNMYSQNRVQIVPKYNLINNVGLRLDSAHSNGKHYSKKLKSIYNMETYDISFPLKHAKYVIPDIQYEIKRNRILNYNEPVLLKVVKYPFKMLTLFFNNPKKFFTHFFNKFLRKKSIEK